MEIYDLSERKRRILAAIIESYIDTAEPVGSKALAEAAGLGVSSATIRNEMAELKELGWLEQPHTSAGSVPSSRGYRAYVDYLMQRYHVSEQESKRTQAFLESRVAELERLIAEAGKLISELSGYPSLTMTPKRSGVAIRHINLVPVDPYQFVLVLVTSEGTVKNNLCRTRQPLPTELLYEITELLNRRLAGVELSQVSVMEIAQLRRSLGEFEFVLQPVLQIIHEAAMAMENPEVILGGEGRLLEQPEFRDIGRMKEFLDFLQDNEARRQVLSPAEGHEGITVTIGQEHPLEQLRDSSVIMGNYRIGDRPVGVIAILGPTRRDYPRVLGQFEYFTNGLNRLLQELFEPPDQ
ncbi:MAG: heat-inducible transcription repressor HrcA [Clostridia bacterium]|nr:heat-inducible transcription repressor HrcA [Clostridia bacterium]